MASFIIEGKEIGIWECDELALFYVDFKVDESSKERYTVTDQDHVPDLKSIKFLKITSAYIKVKMADNKNLVFFSSLETQDLFKNILKYI